MEIGWPTAEIFRRKNKIGTEVVHVTSDSDTTFKLKYAPAPVNLQGQEVAASGTDC